MGFLEDKQKENKFAVILSAVAVIIALFAGIFAGRGFGKILLTLILAGIIFYALGFGIGMLLKKFVPEIFEDEKMGSNIDATVEDEDDEEREEVEYGDENELDNAMQDDGDDSYLVDKSSTVGGKDGKVSIKTPEGVLEEDPENVAKAIRTMMKKDE